MNGVLRLEDLDESLSVLFLSFVGFGAEGCGLILESLGSRSVRQDNDSGLMPGQS